MKRKEGETCCSKNCKWFESNQESFMNDKCSLCKRFHTDNYEVDIRDLQKKKLEDK